MPTVLTGALGVEDVLAGKKVRDVSPGLYQKYQTLNPLLALMMKMPKGRRATNELVEWTRKDLLTRWDAISAVTTASGAAITVTPTNVSYFKVGDVVQIPQLNPAATETDIGVVTTKTTTIVITAVGWQSNSNVTAATFPTVTVGMNLHILHDASEEYSQSPAMKVTQDEQEWNYPAFLRAPYAIGNIKKDGKNYTGPERAERRAETHRDIRIQMEEDLFHGERYYRDGTNGRQFFMRGFRRYIQQGGGNNVLDWSGGLTEADFDEYLLKGPMKSGLGGKVRFGFFSDDLILKLTEIGKAKQRITSEKVNVLGMAFDVYKGPNGVRLLFTDHHLLVNDYEGAGLIVDPTRARIRPYGTQGQLQFHSEIQENDRAGIKDEWRILMSLEVDRFEPHGWIHK